MKFQWPSSENFLTLVTKMPPVLKDMKTKKCLLKMMLHIHFLKRSWMISACQRTLPNCRHPDWKKKKTPLWQCSHLLLPQQASRVPLFFLYNEGLGVLCRYCAASDQAWSATVRTQRLETVHWQQQVITEMCSLDYTEGEVWSGEVCTGENWLWSGKWFIFVDLKKVNFFIGTTVCLHQVPMFSGHVR